MEIVIIYTKYLMFIRQFGTTTCHPGPLDWPEFNERVGLISVGGGLEER